MSKSLPARPDLEQLKKQAKELHRALSAGDAEAWARFQAFHPPSEQAPSGAPHTAKISLSEAQWVLAREYGFPSWRALAEKVDAVRADAENPHEAIRQAFADDDAPRLKALLARYPQFKTRINEPAGPFGTPAITQARSREMLDLLLNAGADINAKSQWWAGGFGLLHLANVDLAEYAISRGATVDLHAAAHLGRIEQVRDFLARDPSLVHARGGDGQTPLHFAADREVAKLLLDHGAEIDARDVDHESTPAQHMAKDRVDVARFLVERGCATDLLLAAALGDEGRVREHLDADPACIHLRVTDEFFPKSNPRSGGTIYQWTLGTYVSAHDVARERGHDAIFRLLMDRSPAGVKLLAACWSGNREVVRSVKLEYPDALGQLNESERRHLAHAARNNNLAAAETMLAAGFPLDARGQHGATALHWAAFHGNVAMVGALLARHPPLELQDDDFKSTPLGWAIHGSKNGWHRRTGNYPGTVTCLLEAGATLTKTMVGGSAEVRVLLEEHLRARDKGSEG